MRVAPAQARAAPAPAASPAAPAAGPRAAREVALGVAAPLATGALIGLGAGLERHLAWVVFVALVPWLAAVERARTLRHSLLLGAGLAAAYAALALEWFPPALAGYSGAPLAACWAATLAGAPLLEPQLVVYALAYRWAAERGGRPAAAHGLAALGWIGSEWLWPKLFDDTLGYALYPLALVRQGADVAGVRGLTLAVLVVSVLVLRAATALAHRRWRAALVPLASAAALVAALAGYGALRARSLSAPAPRALTVAIVQPNLSAYDKRAAEVGTYAVVESVLTTHFTLTDDARAQRPLDLVVWPETVYPTTFGSPKSDDGAAFDRAIGGFVADRGIPLLFGTYDREGDREFNAAVLLDPHGNDVEMETYRKTLLFPLTERVPAWLDGAALRAALPWTGRWSPGDGPHMLALAPPAGRVSMAPLICYEAMSTGYVAAAVRQGADLLVTLSNDAWFAGGRAARLVVAAAAFRSIETRRPQVRATTTGISAVITPSGALAGALDAGERAALVREVALPGRPWTPVVGFGDWLGPAALVGAVAAAAALAVRPRRPRADPRA